MEEAPEALGQAGFPLTPLLPLLPPKEQRHHWIQWDPCGWGLPQDGTQLGGQRGLFW